MDDLYSSSTLRAINASFALWINKGLLHQESALYHLVCRSTSIHDNI